ncbi:hypothetical protein [Ideonella alba]|uniref:Uncharacterized protein n=1 Tax=Ideonella alba TaxID=2824118 RepID=A0A940YCH7_9BURK|nr:hypothetical protein [Ideonella alba]MBQ0930581.1 hypothetical protein [Ideonella alba]
MLALQRLPRLSSLRPPHGWTARVRAAGPVLALALLGAGAHPGLRAAGHPLLGSCAEPLTPDCAERLESRALQAHGEQARRESGQLSLSPPVDAARPPTVRWLGPLADSGLDLLVEFPPGQPPAYRLAGEGAPPLRLPGPAWPAPGGRLLISTGTLAEDQPVVVLLGRVESRWRVLLRQEASPGGRLSFIGWRNDGAAARLQWQCRGGSALALQLRDGPYGWDWVPPLPSRCGR